VSLLGFGDPPPGVVVADSQVLDQSLNTRFKLLVITVSGEIWNGVLLQMCGYRRVVGVEGGPRPYVTHLDQSDREELLTFLLTSDTDRIPNFRLDPLALHTRS